MTSHENQTVFAFPDQETIWFSGADGKAHLYLLVLTIAGVLSGIAIGVAANYLLESLNKIPIWK